MVDRYPLDFEALHEGMWIEGEMLRNAVVSDPDTDPYKFNFELMQLCKRIEKETRLLCRCDHGRIRVMTAEEGVEHCERMFLQRMRGQFHQEERAALIERAQLDGEGQHNLDLLRLRIAQINRATRKELFKQDRLMRLVGVKPKEVESGTD